MESKHKMMSQDELRQAEYEFSDEDTPWSD